MKTITHRSEHLNKLKAEYTFKKMPDKFETLYVQRTKVRITTEASLETMQARRVWDNIFKNAEENCHARMHSSGKQ